MNRGRGEIRETRGLTTLGHKRERREDWEERKDVVERTNNNIAIDRRVI